MGKKKIAHVVLREHTGWSEGQRRSLDRYHPGAMASQMVTGPCHEVRAAAGLGRWEQSREDVCASVRAWVQVCLCVQAHGGQQLLGWARLCSSRKWRLFWPIRFLTCPSSSLQRHTQNLTVGTSLSVQDLNCSHFTVPARLGVNAGGIVSLPDGAEQHKRVSLWWQYTFPCPPLKLRYPTVCVIRSGSFLFL